MWHLCRDCVECEKRLDAGKCIERETISGYSARKTEEKTFAERGNSRVFVWIKISAQGTLPTIGFVVAFLGLFWESVGSFLVILLVPRPFWVKLGAFSDRNAKKHASTDQ